MKSGKLSFPVRIGISKPFFIDLFVYLIPALLFLSGYFISRSVQKSVLVRKEINYTSAQASEMYLVWGIINTENVSEKYWPANSYFKKEVIYSKMERAGQQFHIFLNLPADSDLYYWILQTRDTQGNNTDVWDSGNREYYQLSFNYPGFFRPGYFIFLAGFVPLLLGYLRNRRKESPVVTDRFKIKEYIPELDSLRAFAVITVILHHWLSEKSLFGVFADGRLGVNIFFVLSGFLITRILLKGKQSMADTGAKWYHVFKKFYIRRTLRIFPIYYLMLVLFLVFKKDAFENDALYHFTYTSNFHFFKIENFSAHFAHLWSLAVEEQFYLLWPFIILFVHKRTLPYVMGFFIIVGISINYIFIEKGWWIEILSPACFDAFATGGLFSFIIIYRQDLITLLQKHFNQLFFVILLLFVLEELGHTFLPHRTVHAFFAVSLIFYCTVVRSNQFINYILTSRWLIFMGKISYGIYLYHLNVPELWEKILVWLKDLNLDLMLPELIPSEWADPWLFFQRFTFLIIISLASWTFIEKPINRLKSKFV